MTEDQCVIWEFGGIHDCLCYALVLVRCAYVMVVFQQVQAEKVVFDQSRSLRAMGATRQTSNEIIELVQMTLLPFYRCSFDCFRRQERRQTFFDIVGKFRPGVDLAALYVEGASSDRTGARAEQP